MNCKESIKENLIFGNLESYSIGAYFSPIRNLPKIEVLREKGTVQYIYMIISMYMYVYFY